MGRQFTTGVFMIWVCTGQKRLASGLLHGTLATPREGTI
jgi:hypothetical protein